MMASSRTTCLQRWLGGSILACLLAVAQGPAALAAGPAAAPQTLYLAPTLPREMPDFTGPGLEGRLTAWSQAAAMGHYSAGRPEAESRLFENMARASSGPALQLRWIALGRIGRQKAQAGEYAQALQAFEEALAAARTASEPHGQAEMLVNANVIRAVLGRYAAALEGLQQAHDLYRDIAAGQGAQAQTGSERPGSAQARQAEPAPGAQARLGQELALLNLGAVHAYTGQYAEAYASYNRALALYPHTPSPAGASIILRGLAAVSLQLGRVEEAQRYALRADRAGASAIEGWGRKAGGVAIVLGGSMPAVAAAPAATASSLRPPPTQPGRAPASVLTPADVQQRALEAQASDAETRGHVEAALAAWRKAAVSAEVFGSADGLRNALVQLQRLHAAAGQPALAIFYGKQAVNEIQRQLGLTTAMSRDAQRAFARRARTVHESLIAALLAESRLAEAEHAMRMERAGASSGLNGTATRMPYNEPEQALLQNDRMLAQGWRRQAEATATLRAANSLLPLPKPTETLESLRQARLDGVEKELGWLEGLDAGRQPAAHARQVVLVTSLPRLAAGLGDTPCAPAGADERRARLDARLARLRAQLSRTPVAVGLAGMGEMDLQSASASLGLGHDPLFGERVLCAQHQQARIERELGSANPVLSRALQAPSPAFAGADAALLDAGRLALAAAAGSAELHYLVGEARLHILMVSAQGRLARAVQMDRRAVEQLVGTYRQALQSKATEPEAAAQRLYRFLLAPIQPELDRVSARTLVLGLDGPLRYVPFAALHDGRQWLVERYATAVDTPGATRVAARAPWRIAGFGSTVGGAGLEPLPGVATELQALVRAAGGGDHGLVPGTIRMDREFTAESLRQALGARYPVIHIASHFKFVSGNADASFLLLGDGTTLPLPVLRRDYRFDGVELIALSACNTALDNIDGYGQEFEGLAAILRQQGAAAVLATLWPVADASTGRFMRGFYGAHEQAGLSRAEALRKAQIEFIGGAASAAAPEAASGTRGAVVAAVTLPQGAGTLPSSSGSTTHPFFWAPFVLSGDWR